MSTLDDAAVPPDAALRNLRWRFAGVVLDGSTLELTLNRQAVRIEPKPLELLLCLLRHPGEVVTKEELHQGVWPGRILSDSVLTKTMTKLRQCLGDESQELIKTVHGYGYRLIAPVTIELLGASASTANLQRSAGDAIPHRPLWQLRQPLGHGGHGDVWLGEHVKTGELRVFKFAVDASGLVALKRELTLYRVLRHSQGAERKDIVRLMDYNLEEPPYFIETEYLAGGSLPQWLDAQGGCAAVPLKLRLDLIAQVADSLASAHSAGVLHKDLKPSNILVAHSEDGSPQAKIGDFGSGRMLDLAQLEALDITRMGFTQTLLANDDSGSGTPLYLAPELLAGQQPTVQSDLYALGVVLYQMVVADFKQPLAPGWERRIEDPLLRQDIAALADLDPSRRLADAAALARRLRTLSERRIEAQASADRAAESEALRVALQRATVRRRFLRSLAAVLALGLGLSSFGFWTARQSQIKAEQAVQETRLINHFLTEDVLGSADPLSSGSRDVSALALLDAARQKLPERFAENPAARIEIDLALSAAYHAMGQLPTALELADHAYKTALQLHGASDPVTLLSAVRRANVIHAQGSYLEAEQAYAAVLAHPDILPSHVSLAARQGRAWNLYYLSRYPEAAKLYEGLLHDLPENQITERENATWGLAEVYGQLSRHAEAETLLRNLIASIERRQGVKHPRAAEMRNNLVSVLLDTNRVDEAEKEALNALAVEREALGPEHPMTLVSAHWMGVIRQRQHRHAEAVAYFAPVLAARIQLYGKDHRRTGYTQRRLAQSYLEIGRIADAERLSRQSYSAALQSGGVAHPDTVRTLLTLVDVLRRSHREDEAASLLRLSLNAGIQQSEKPEWLDELQAVLEQVTSARKNKS